MYICGSLCVSVDVHGCVWICLPVSVCVCARMPRCMGVCKCNMSGCRCKCVSINVVWICVGVCEGGWGKLWPWWAAQSGGSAELHAGGTCWALIWTDHSPLCWTEPSFGNEGGQPQGPLLPWSGAKPWHDPLWRHQTISEGWWSVRIRALLLHASSPSGMHVFPSSSFSLLHALYFF